MSPDHNADWLHQNDMYRRETICRLSEDQESNVDVGSMAHGPSTLSIREPSSPTIESSSEEDDEPCRLPSLFLSPAQSVVMGISQGESSRGTTTGRAEARSERDRARHASMTPDQVARRRALDRERYANETPEQRQARRVRRNARKAVRRTSPGTNNASTCILQGESSTGTSQIINCGNAANNTKISHESCLLKHDVPFLFCSSYYIYT